MENGAETHQKALFSLPELVVSKFEALWSRVFFHVCKHLICLRFQLIVLSLGVLLCVKTCACQHVWRMYGGNDVWPEIKTQDKGPNPGKKNPQSREFLGKHGNDFKTK